MNNKIILTVIDGEISLIQKPNFIDIEIRDYIDIDNDYPEVHKDNDGNTYRVFSFPAEKEIVSVVTTSIEYGVEKEEKGNYRNYYCHNKCNVKWDDDWSCMCNDRCPVCNTKIEPYQSEDLDTGKIIEHFNKEND